MSLRYSTRQQALIEAPIGSHSTRQQALIEAPIGSHSTRQQALIEAPIGSHSTRQQALIEAPIESHPTDGIWSVKNWDGALLTRVQVSIIQYSYFLGCLKFFKLWKCSPTNCINQ